MVPLDSFRSSLALSLALLLCPFLRKNILQQSHNQTIYMFILCLIIHFYPSVHIKDEFSKNWAIAALEMRLHDIV